MTNQPTPQPITKSSSETPSETERKSPSVISCLFGSLTAAAIAAVLYLLTSSIAQNFASKPPQSTNMTVLKISAAVRTLVVGMSALGTGIFGIAALGLFALGIQILWQRLRKTA